MGGICCTTDTRVVTAFQVGVGVGVGVGPDRFSVVVLNSEAALCSTDKHGIRVISAYNRVSGVPIIGCQVCL